MSEVADDWLFVILVNNGGKNWGNLSKILDDWLLEQVVHVWLFNVVHGANWLLFSHNLHHSLFLIGVLDNTAGVVVDVVSNHVFHVVVAIIIDHMGEKIGNIVGEWNFSRD